ncbi:protein phosphatase 1 regulatory inhibitor subunit PPP1R8 homolog [Drosophila erecta]|uniref:FHA domain-containing protein n=1 Tax=Drosophila erecta TaxID=7220 RepID=B3NXL5_DROER|nr:protein phosphatase 1 regulatory inhibitor subunit PPP1R8 homolog [Drosophila erecta]EDV47316.1 uncharacterized protein Dere_GG17709 [Drosophila erecta]
MTFYLEHVFTGDMIHLDEGVHIMGRHSNCTSILKYDYMSRFHALVLVKHGKIFVKELETYNGVFINYSLERVGTEWQELSVGDDLCFGVKLYGEVAEEIPITFGIFTVKEEELHHSLAVDNGNGQHNGEPSSSP